MNQLPPPAWLETNLPGTLLRRSIPEQPEYSTENGKKGYTEYRRFQTLDISSLVDHLINYEHMNARINAVKMYELAKQLSANRGVPLPGTFLRFFTNLFNQMNLQEQILFPNILQLLKNKQENKTPGYTTFGLIEQLTTDLKRGHQSASEELQQLRMEYNAYARPSEKSHGLAVLIDQFESDLTRHFHLEEDYLFPKAIQLDEFATS